MRNTPSLPSVGDRPVAADPDLPQQTPTPPGPELSAAGLVAPQSVSSAQAVAKPASDSSQKAFVATDSPCVAVCSTLFDEICRGCGRSAMEVSNWVFMTEEEKQLVWTRIRSQGYPRRKG